VKNNIPIEEWIKPIKEMNRLRNIKLKHSIDINKKSIIFNFTIINRKLVWTRGSSNRTKDNKRIFYIDYDNMKESFVKEELLMLQERYCLGDILIFQSSENGFHGVSFAKLSLGEFVDILNNSSCDYAFKNMPHYLKFSRYWILRNFDKGSKKKPKYLYTLTSKTDRKQSFAHWKYFNILYPDSKINQLTNSDGLEDITIVDYPTGTNI